MSAASKACAATVGRKLLAPGIKNLKSYLQSELNVLRWAPVLLISSNAGASSSKLKPVADSCQWVQFTLGQQFSMRTVPTTISLAFPTKDSLDQTLELMQRTGASSVVSVGSGAAMDLGKAVQATLGSSTDAKKTPLILVPTTYGGVLAAGVSHSLFLDGNEETLVPLPRSHQEIISTPDDASNIMPPHHEETLVPLPRSHQEIISTPDDASTHNATVSTLEPQKYMEHLDTGNFDVLLYAVSVILLDAGLRKRTHLSLPTLLQDTIDLISLRKNRDASSEESDNEELMVSIPSLTNLLFQSAGLLLYGLSNGFEE
eukprot:CAMPEP_0171325192 /NCGR_PEP_ID=MMETSP0816-20121228/116649_1 /TAXON_ID=420281 /ORGANISM="Proboscia inermis, Strain CCAP1064/1" /LENGTH=315 /DNA_ID=CAMNT_0011824297 /DNA_START=330 /DNA_END=1278 /DNA_ORIENTATION=+